MRFGLLGNLRVVDDRGVREAVSAGKQRIILAALLLRPGQATASEELAAAVWGGSAPTSVKASLANHLARLRRTLGPETRTRLQTEPGGYRLVLRDDDTADHLLAASLDTRATAAARVFDWTIAEALAETALSLWHGEPLADIPSVGLHTAHVPALDALRSRLQLTRVDAVLHNGGFARAGSAIAELLDRNPLHEPFHERQLAALYGAGRRADALEAYRRARTVLWTELGVEPSPTLCAVHQLILTAAEPAKLLAALSPWPAAFHERPASATPASREIFAELTRVLAPGDPAPPSGGIAILAGPAPAAATGTALAWAKEVGSGFPDGLIRLDLRYRTGRETATGVNTGADRDADAASLTDGDPDTAVRELLARLGVPDRLQPTTADGRIGLHRSLTAGRRLLLILENSVDAEQVRTLLPSSPTCRVLIIGDRPLDSLVALEGAHRITMRTPDTSRSADSGSSPARG